MPRTLITAVLLLLVGAAATWWWVAAVVPLGQPRPGQRVEYPAFQQPQTLPLPASAAADECIQCHQRESPAIVVQWARSKHAASDYTCVSCHKVEAAYPGAVEHEGAWIMKSVTPRKCAECHLREATQFARSRHSLPAWAAMTGIDDFKNDPNLLAQYYAIEEIPRVAGTSAGQGEPLPRRNALYDIEGKNVTPVACERCHSIGKPQADGSAGRCVACHSRHEFDIAQVRKPETCNNCHIGPDHPQFEIYMESKHGIKYATLGETWNWSALPGTLDTLDFPAPTCAICHISGFGPEPTTHDVGNRLSLFLHEPVTNPRPNYAINRQRMQNVCLQCHNNNFVQAEYQLCDNLTGRTNELVRQAETIMRNLIDRKLVGRSSAPQSQFDEPIEFTAFELWHHWGRTSKFGAYMQGADYTQWHGIYELLADLTELKAEAAALLREAANNHSPATAPDDDPAVRLLLAPAGPTSQPDAQDHEEGPQ